MRAKSSVRTCKDKTTKKDGISRSEIFSPFSLISSVRSVFISFFISIPVRLPFFWQFFADFSVISFACKLGLDHCVGISFFFFFFGFEAFMLDFNGFSCISSGVAVISVECVVSLCGFLKFFALGEVKVELGDILFPR